MELPESGASGESGLDLPPAVFVARLKDYERVLLELKDHLYEGSWDRMLGDLKARLENRPYLYRLSVTIARDIAAIERMKAYEARQGVKLSELAGKN